LGESFSFSSGASMAMPSVARFTPRYACFLLSS
jgi:hypothetical protein